MSTEIKLFFSSEELYVIVEFCKFGNLQKYIECKRGTYISQIHPDTGRFDDNYPPGLGTDDVKYTNIVFPAQKPFTADHIRSLTKDNLEAESEGRLEAKPPLSRAAPRMSHFSTTTTDSDYLSTIPTETTDYMATYTALEGGYLDLY